MPFIIFFTNIPPGTDKKVPPPVCVPLFPAVPSPACRAFGGPGYLVQRCINITVMSTRYSCQHRVVVGQRCHRIASLLRLVLTGISSTHYCNINATLYWEAAGGGACRLFPILVFLFTRLLLVGNNIIIHSLQKKYPFGSKS